MMEILSFKIMFYHATRWRKEPSNMHTLPMLLHGSNIYRDRLTNIKLLAYVFELMFYHATRWRNNSDEVDRFDKSCLYQSITLMFVPTQV
jgi:hypothetical protein